MLIMLFADSFLSIAGPSEGLFRDRGSRFMAFAFPVKNENIIKEHLQNLRVLHSSAVHHCYAWRLGADKLQYRANDDGEPSGSAGKPILGQIQSKDLTNILIVVVRYFGGTLLGVPGLINAYKTAAAEALDKANIEEQYILYDYQISYDAEDTSAVMRLLRDLHARIVENGYDERHVTRFHLKKQYVTALSEGLTELYKTNLQLIAQLP